MTDPKDARISALECQVDALKTEMQHLSVRLSHDLRAPLRHITSYAKLIQDEAGPGLTEDAQSFLGTISDSARHMGQMLDALAELSRIATVPLQCQDVSLGELVQEVQQQLQVASADRVVQWNIQGLGQEDVEGGFLAHWPTVHTDAALLRLALVQVVGNALRFTAKCDVARISLAVQVGAVVAPDAIAQEGVTAEPEAGAEVTITVRDNGAGYNAAQKSHLFRPFSRLHSSSQFAGLGMGLAWSRQALRRLGGDINLETHPDGGCCATLSLPGQPR